LERKLDEFSFIKNKLKPLATSKHALKLQDDVATLPKGKIIFSTDTIVEHIHFFPNTEGASLARKLLGVSISDIIAKGIKPEFYSLNLSLNNTSPEWLSSFCKGLKLMQKKYNISLLGGDTTKTNSSIVLSATIYGTYKKKFITRNNAKPNQNIYITGHIGDAYPAITKSFQSKKNTIPHKDYVYLEDKYLHPEPNLNITEILQKYASSSIDISDGLTQDLNHILTASFIGAEIDLNTIPLSNSLQRFLKIFPKEKSNIFNAGDDYQVIFTAGKKYHKKITNQSELITKIGETTKNTELKLISDLKTAKQQKGFSHF
jgi:thiamine-monophosphate kinase